MDPIPVISHINILGDSLSDRGKVAHRKIADIPMRLLTDLPGKSPDGRFTNGIDWDDHFCAAIANQFTIDKFEKKKKLDPCDIADGIISKDPYVSRAIKREYSLNNDTYITYDGRDFARTYCEGGLTAHNYKWALSDSVIRFFSRLILSNLDEKRKVLLDYDKKNQLSQRTKRDTLTIEWSGANDLITVNKRPSLLEVKKAIAARVKNAVDLINHGYRHFILFNLPDLSLTPRYQALNKAEQDNTQACCNAFNQALNEACAKLREAHPDCTIEVFDVNKHFTKIYENADIYGFDKAKLKTPYSTSKEYEASKNGTIPSRGFMFWDDVHPTAEVHALLASIFCKEFESKFQFVVPEKMVNKKEDRAVLMRRLSSSAP